MMYPIKNVFMDFESHKLLQDKYSLDDLIAEIISKVDESNPTSIMIGDERLEIEYHCKNDYLGFVFTVYDGIQIDQDKTKFQNSIYLYSQTALKNTMKAILE